MIPIKNKKKTLEVTVEEMRNFAFNYIEKFAPSKQQLKTYLLKKYLKSKNPSVKKSNISDLLNPLNFVLWLIVSFNDILLICPISSCEEIAICDKFTNQQMLDGQKYRRTAVKT